MPAYELAAYGPAQREDYLRLLHQAWGDDTLTGDEFDWWFGRNPAGSLMSVARDDGRVIGGGSPSLYRRGVGGGGRRPAVVGHKRPGGRAVALVADLVGPVRPLLRACIAGVRPGARVLFAVPGRGEAAAYLSSGFVPTPRSLHFMGKPLAGPLDLDPRAW